MSVTGPIDARSVARPAPPSLYLAGVAVVVVVVCAGFGAYFSLSGDLAKPTSVVVGVGTWAAVYAAVVLSRSFRLFIQGRGVARTLLIVYGLRVAVALAAMSSFLTLIPPYAGWAAALDIWIGLVALKFTTVGRALPEPWQAYPIVIVDGLIQQIPIAVAFGVLLPLIRWWSPPARRPAGFDVITDPAPNGGDDV